VYVYAGVLNYETIARRAYLVSGTHVLRNYILSDFMGTLDYRMMIEVFLLSVLDK
jgi:hypothetical protein